MDFANVNVDQLANVSDSNASSRNRLSNSNSHAMNEDADDNDNSGPSSDNTSAAPQIQPQRSLAQAVYEVKDLIFEDTKTTLWQHALRLTAARRAPHVTVVVNRHRAAKAAEKAREASIAARRAASLNVDAPPAALAAQQLAQSHDSNASVTAATATSSPQTALPPTAVLRSVLGQTFRQVLTRYFCCFFFRKICNFIFYKKQLHFEPPAILRCSPGQRPFSVDYEGEGLKISMKKYIFLFQILNFLIIRWN